jgi:hypothetical protein
MTTLSRNRSTRLTPAKIHEIVTGEDFSPREIHKLSEYQKRKIHAYIRGRLPRCQPRERKILTQRLALFATDADLRQDTWEYHHANICTALAGYLQEQEIMPTRAVLAAKTGYTRQTISKHLKAFREHSVQGMDAGIGMLLKSRVTEKMLVMALKGDVRAAKVYLEAVSRRPAPEKKAGVKMQNNFIRINGLVISEERLSRLRPEQLSLLEELLGTDRENATSLPAGSVEDSGRNSEKKGIEGTGR